MNNEDLLKKINYLIEINDLEKVKEVLNLYKTKESNIEIINYLDKKLLEKEDFNNLEEKVKLKIDYYIKKGHELSQKNNLNYVLSCYIEALNQTKYNIFNYYIGKICFKLGSYDSASFYLKRYNEKGINKIFKSYLYLAVIAKVKKESYEHYLDKIKLISIIENNSFRPVILDKNIIQGYTNETNENQTLFDKQYNIEILNNIKHLYQTGHTKEADKYLKELIQKKDKTSEEKKEINELQKCKKLYIIQHKINNC